MEFGSKEDLDDDDILPDTNIDRERTTTGRWAIFVFFVSATFMTVAMVSPNWIEADERFYGTKVQRVGLWVHCFRSFPDYNDPEHQRFYAGCRWRFNPFTPGYDQIRNFLAPRRVKLISILHTLWTVNDVPRKYIIPFGKIPWGSLQFLRGLSMAFPMERPLKSCKDLSGNRRFKIRDNM